MKNLLLFLFLLQLNLLPAQSKKGTAYYEKQAGSKDTYVKAEKIQDGPHTFYNKNKKLIAEGTFKNGKLFDGKKYSYNAKGALIKTELVSNGVSKSNSSAGKSTGASKSKSVSVDVSKTHGLLTFDKECSYKIYSVTGKLLLTGKSFDINFYRKLPRGTYIVKTEDKDYKVNAR